MSGYIQERMELINERDALITAFNAAAGRSRALTDGDRTSLMEAVADTVRDAFYNDIEDLTDRIEADRLHQSTRQLQSDAHARH